MDCASILEVSRIIVPLKCRNATFYGVGHGLAGMVSAMMNFPEVLKKNADAEKKVKDCCDYLLSVDSSCRLPGGPQMKEVICHWCHGAPGVSQMMCKAYKVIRIVLFSITQAFGDQKYLEAAQRGADSVWKEGLLKKGNGIW